MDWNSYKIIFPFSRVSLKEYKPTLTIKSVIYKFYNSQEVFLNTSKIISKSVGLKQGSGFCPPSQLDAVGMWTTCWKILNCAIFEDRNGIFLLTIVTAEHSVFIKDLCLTKWGLRSSPVWILPFWIECYSQLTLLIPLVVYLILDEMFQKTTKWKQEDKWHGTLQVKGCE